MDADYGRILDADGNRIDRGEWQNALFILTSVMSHAKPDRAICDAGLKAQSVDSGLPVVFGRSDVTYVKCSDEHGVIEDPAGVLEVNDKLRLVPGHCDPTCNVHDWNVGVRGGRVEVVWPVSARGKAYRGEGRPEKRACTCHAQPMHSPCRCRDDRDAVGGHDFGKRIALGAVAAELGLPFEAVTLDRLGAEADVIVTITSSPAAALLDRQVCPGTHLACMGTDTRGKQEVEPALLARATVFADEVAQSVSIGEAQHAVALGLLAEGTIVPLGPVLTGGHPGRTFVGEITLFDGTGVGLQDLAVTAVAVTRARERGVGVEVAV